MQFPILDHMAFYTDSTNNAGIKEIRSVQASGGFAIDPMAYHSFGITNFNNWCFFRISNREKQKRLVLDVSDRYLDIVELYIYYHGKPYVSFKTKGWKLPLSQRPIPGVRQAFPIILADTGVYNCYLKFHRTAGTTVGVVFLQSPEQFYSEAMIENHISYIVQGAIILLIIAGFSLYCLRRDKLYLWYVLQNIALLIYISAKNGILSFYLLGRWDLFAGPPSNFVSSLLYSFTHLVFVIIFFRVKQTFGKWIYGFAQVVLFIDVVLLILIFTSAIPSLKYQLLYLTYLLSASVSVALLVVGIHRRNRDAMIYGIAETPLIMTIAYYVYAIFFHVSNSWIPLYGSQIAPLFEVSVFAIALAQRYTSYGRQNTALLSDLNEAQTQIIDVQDAERQRIAQDLHDELGGNLAAIKMSLQSTGLDEEKIFPLLKLIDEASVNTRNIAHNLMPPNFEDVNLIELLKNHFNKLDQDGKIRFHFHANGYPEEKFNKRQELTLYRIIMELVSNVINHAEAYEATIQLIGYQTYLELMVEDDGKGFARSGQKGIGLKNIQSRINFLKGTFNIDSSGRGTTIVIQLPY